MVSYSFTSVSSDQSPRSPWPVVSKQALIPRPLSPKQWDYSLAVRQWLSLVAGSQWKLCWRITTGYSGQNAARHGGPYRLRGRIVDCGSHKWTKYLMATQQELSKGRSKLLCYMQSLAAVFRCVRSRKRLQALMRRRFRWRLSVKFSRLFNPHFQTSLVTCFRLASDARVAVGLDTSPAWSRCFC